MAEYKPYRLALLSPDGETLETWDVHIPETGTGGSGDSWNMRGNYAKAELGQEIDDLLLKRVREGAKP